MERSTGEVLMAQNEDELMFPASTTKIMTALLALQFGDLNDVLTVSEQALILEEGAEAAAKGVEAIADLAARCGIPSTLTALGIGRENVEALADAAMKVTRLLVNNPREVTREDAIAIYNELY